MKGGLPLKKHCFVLLPMLAGLLFAACAAEEAPREVLPVFAEVTEDYESLLTDPADAALWQELQLPSLTLEGEGERRIIGREDWLVQPALQNGEACTVYLKLQENEWKLDAAASFGVNDTPAAEWLQQSNLFTAAVNAALSDEPLPEAYAKLEDDSYYTVALSERGGEAVIAVARRASDEDALYALLSRGGEHAIRLRLAALPDQNTLRVTHYLGEGWLDEEAILREQNTALMYAVGMGDLQTVDALLGNDNRSVTDPNGDGLLFLALQSGSAEMVELVAGRGCTDEMGNIYAVEEDELTDFEEKVRQRILLQREVMGLSNGCCEGTAVRYLLDERNSVMLAAYLEHYSPETELSEAESALLAEQYKVEAGERANLLDAAVLNDDAPSAEVLLQHNVGATELLRQKLRADPTDFSDEVLAVLGARQYFGELDEVMGDYRAFRESYEAEAGEICRRFAQEYAEYRAAFDADDAFAAAALWDSGLRVTILDQLAAVQKVAYPKTPAIADLWELMFDYADMMDTAGYYYRHITYTTYIVNRRYYRYLFENRLGRADKLYEQFLREKAVYDRLLDQMG